MMPMDLILVRHGQSEENVAIHMSKRGDNSIFTKEFLRRHTSEVRLTNQGIRQAQITGDWLKKNINTNFSHYYTSDYLRAKETAAFLGLPDAKWQTEFALRERERSEDNLINFKDGLEATDVHQFYWRPIGGESMADTCLRVDKFLHKLHLECSNKRVIVVSHGEVMWAFRILLEKMSQQEWIRLFNSKDPCDRMNNGQVLQYSRENLKTGTIASYPNWMRSICPNKQEWSRPEWREIIHNTSSNEDLLLEVQKYPRICNLEY